MKQIRRRLTYANVMSTIAVFLVLGGATAIAAGLAKNSVGPKQLKKNAVTAAKIKKGAVTGAKVKPGSLTASNFAAGQLPAGPKGDTGPSFGAFANGGCGELGESYAECASTGSVDLPSPGHVLLIATAEWDNDDEGGTPPNSGRCQLTVDGTPIPREVYFGEDTDTHRISESGSISMNWITGPLPAGSHSFGFECRESAGSAYVAETMLSAVLLGSASVREQKVLLP